MKRKNLLVIACLTVWMLTACGTEDGNIESVSVTEAESVAEIEDLEETFFVSRKFTDDERFARQPEMDDLLQNEYEAGYTLENAKCIVDPYGLSPLTAIVFFETEKETSVEVIVEGKDKDTTISHSFGEISRQHSVPIYGLYANTENKVKLIVTDDEGNKYEKLLTVQTDALPSDISHADVEVADKIKMAEGLTFFDCPHIDGNYFLAIDSNGDIRWYLSDKSFNGSVMLTHLNNGNFLIGSGEVIPDSYNNLYRVFEVTPFGQYVNEYNVYGAHHDIREKSNGDLIFAASMDGSESQNDYIVEIKRETGEVLRDWNLRDIIPMTEYDTQYPYTGGLSNWLHNNAVWYIEDEDAFVISGRHQNMVMKFDAGTKEIKWILSGTVGTLNEELRPYLLTPVNDNFEYPISQHAAMMTKNGELMLFDNRNLDVLDAAGELIQENLYSRAVKYEINEENKTIEEIWEYGKDERELYSSFVSDVDEIGENHYLIDFGGQYRAEDGTNYDHIFTDKAIKNASIRNSVVVEIVDNEVVFKATLTGNSNSNSYKAERKDIYQNAMEVNLYFENVQY